MRELSPPARARSGDRAGQGVGARAGHAGEHGTRRAGAGRDPAAAHSCTLGARLPAGVPGAAENLVVLEVFADRLQDWLDVEGIILYSESCSLQNTSDRIPAAVAMSA